MSLLVTTIIVAPTLSGCSDIFFTGWVLEYEVYTIDPSTLEIISASTEQVDAKARLLEAQLNSIGYANATVIRRGNSVLRIMIPYYIANIATVKLYIGLPRTLEFWHNDAVILTGRNIESVGYAFNGATNNYAVFIRLDRAGGHALYLATLYTGSTIYIFSTGAYPVVISAPTVQAQITDGNFSITGLTRSEAQNMSRLIFGNLGLSLRLLNYDYVHNNIQFGCA